ncbi:SpoIID/LytB domain-containing protein [Synechococcus sp. UW179A]|uniref:SpoIID/LytB domain-containing protein n=1 Tax=Synechococcus sp. UW179A TaxID=2575510 RepID=UPI001FCAC2CD|nr:SpoIID/LytB domain-containing protein [Synechococcus sp. UW179A]
MSRSAPDAVFRLLPWIWLPVMTALGCQAEVIEQQVIEPPSPQSELVAVPTHRRVPLPPLARNSVLWVSLDDHLGAGTGSDRSAAQLTLISAGAAPLQLRDRTGKLVLSADQLRFSWRRVALPEPLDVARRVAGPFASFESADQIAQRWRAQGVKAQVAHPGEWEVWAPADALDLAGVTLSDVSERISSVVMPVLEGPTGGRTLEGPLQVQASDGMRWKGGVLPGPFRLQADAYGSWTLLEKLPLERYLEGVVPHEIGAGSPAAALQAQAVLARTWALANSHRFALDGYHLCSDTQCQVYSDPRMASPSVRQAIRATSGEVLLWDGQPIHAVYHATNGGVSAHAEEAWDMEPLPYVRAQPDGATAWGQSISMPLLSNQDVQSLLNGGDGAYGAGHPRFRWSRVYTAGQLGQALAAAGQGNAAPTSMSVKRRGPSGRVLSLEIDRDRGAAPVVLKLDAIRRTLRRLPSTLFVVEAEGAGAWRFRGGGFGHGVGLSQAGAIDLADRGWSAERILQHYYPGTQLGPFTVPAESVPAEAP